jgi:hypothetical protein
MLKPFFSTQHESNLWIAGGLKMNHCTLTETTTSAQPLTHTLPEAQPFTPLNHLTLLERIIRHLTFL